MKLRTVRVMLPLVRLRIPDYLGAIHKLLGSSSVAILMQQTIIEMHSSSKTQTQPFVFQPIWYKYNSYYCNEVCLLPVLFKVSIPYQGQNCFVNQVSLHSVFSVEVFHKGELNSSYLHIDPIFIIFSCCIGDISLGNPKSSHKVTH